MLFLVICTGGCSEDDENLNYENGGGDQIPPSTEVEPTSYKQETDSGTWYDSVLFDGDINPSDSFQNGYPIQMLAGDTVHVVVSSKLPINVYVTDPGTFGNYLVYGKWGYSDSITQMTGWPYYEDFSAFNVMSHEFTVPTPDDYILCMVVNDASGDLNNEAHVTIIRNQQQSDEYHQQVYTGTIDAQIEYMEKYGDERAESFSYGD